MAAKRIGFLLYSDVQALDVAGPMDTFDCVRIGEPGAPRCGYEIVTFALDETAVRCESELRR